MPSSAPHPLSNSPDLPAVESRPWPWLLILGLVFALSSGDRAILGVLKTTLSAELGFSQADYARLVAALLLPYALMLLVIGGQVNRHGARRVLAACLLVISLSTALSGCARSLSHLMLAQVTLGLAQAGIAPTVAWVILQRMPARRHASAYSTVNAIQSLATILCPPFVAVVTLAFGWRYAFLLPALAGLGLAALWWHLSVALEPEAGTVTRCDGNPGRSALAVLWQQPAVRRLLLARMISDPFWFFFQFWQAAFLRERIGLSLADIGRLAWIPPLAAVLGVLAFSLVSDRLVARGWPETSARLRPLLWVTVLAPAAFALPLLHAPAPALALCVLVNVMCAVWLSLSTILLGTLVRGPQLAPALGIVSALGCLAAIGYCQLAGLLLDRVGYTWPFWAGACLHPLAAALLGGVTDRRRAS